MVSITLNDLQEGQHGTILDVEGNDAIAARLLEMGLIPGQAPMGDPVEFSVVGYRLSLRRIEARRVRIERT